MNIYRWTEIILYALTSYLPVMFLAVYPFHRSLRFSKAVTFIGLLFLGCIRVGLTYWTYVAARRGIAVLVGTIVSALFFVAFMKEQKGKCLFALLMFSNLHNFILVAAKNLERLCFPKLYLEPYRWSSSLTFFIVEILILIPLFFYYERLFRNAMKSNNPAWNYLWLIPLTFYSVWFRNFYFGAEGSRELARRPQYLLFSLVINAGAMLVYTIVAQMMLQYEQNIVLREKAHQLSLQHTMYGNIQDRIDEARRMKHDAKQHVHVISAYLQEEKYEELRKYLEQYQRSMAFESPITYCDNLSVNALLQYFAGYAKIIKSGFSASLQLPKDIGIPDEVLTVALGNLLENAVEACISLEGMNAAISVHGKLDKGALFFKIVNTCPTAPKSDSKGQYLSSKRKGYGIGLQSVQNIAERYNGKMKAYWENGTFIVSLLLNIP